jgi:hypothetical protein
MLYTSKAHKQFGLNSREYDSHINDDVLTTEVICLPLRQNGYGKGKAVPVFS